MNIKQNPLRGAKGKQAKKLYKNEWVRRLIIVSAIMIFIVVGSMVLLNIYTRHGERYVLPAFSGMTIEEAEQLAKEMDIEFVIIDSIYIASMNPGVILDQTPKPGNFIKSGRRVMVTTNTFAPKSVVVPYVTGYSLRQAKNKILSSGLLISKITYRRDIATNNVLMQLYQGREITPNSNLTVPVNSGIELIVGLEHDGIEVRTPDVIGEPLYNAQSRLWEEGFNVRYVSGAGVDRSNIDRAMVYKQEPLPIYSLPLGQSITIYLTTDSTVMKRGVIAQKLDIEKKIIEMQAYEILGDSIKSIIENIAEPDTVVDEEMYIE